MTPHLDEHKQTLLRFSHNMKVMVATLDILDRSTRGELNGQEAKELLASIKQQFYSTL